MFDNQRPSSPSRNVRCRRIEDADLERIVGLLTHGFAPARPRQFWEEIIKHLATRTLPAGTPRYGFLLESEQSAVGVLLQIFSRLPPSTGIQPTLRCNVSSWYVDPEFRTYAPLLVTRALKQKDVTYLNVSPSPHTRPILEAQGYTRYAQGCFVAFACVSAAGPKIPLRITSADTPPQAPCEGYERELLNDHAARGCTSLWCETAERAYPFVFRIRRLKGFIPCAQLIYCPDIKDFVSFARPLGRYLAGRGNPLVILDANGPMPGLRGKYFTDANPKYFKGQVSPRLGDLAYTEIALFGI